MKSNNNILLVTEDEFSEDEDLSSASSETLDNSDYDYWDVFTYENLRQEYNFQTGETSLYIRNPDNSYELLYENSINNGLESATFYSKNSAFMLEGYNPDTHDIESLIHLPKDDFIRFANKKDKSDRIPLLSKVFDIFSPFFIGTSYTTLIKNGVYNKSDNKLLKEYRSLFIKYKCSTAYIPVTNILDDLITNIHLYIASGKIDMNFIQQRYLELQNFKKICSSSYSLLSSFITNPKSTNLRKLCDKLEKNSNNIDNLLDLYLEDELNIKARGENDDCK